MQIYPDFRAFVELFSANKVEYLIIGAHALASHGRPRYTSDLDVFVRGSDANLAALLLALEAFGFGSLKLTPADFGPDQFVRLGVAPVRIDITATVSGLDFDEAWNDRVKLWLNRRRPPPAARPPLSLCGWFGRVGRPASYPAAQMQTKLEAI